MATPSTLSIYNKALVLCGASTITSLAQDTQNARSLSAIVDDARRGFLTECMWSFSTTRSSLATVATSTIAWFQDEEAFVYSRPTDALRIWRMSQPRAVWREEGEFLIADTSGLGVKWTFDHTEYGLWRPKALTAFIDKLCSDIAYIILNSASKGETMLKKYTDVSLPAAMAENAQTGAQQEMIDDAWEISKYGGGGSRPDRSYG